MVSHMGVNTGIFNNTGHFKICRVMDPVSRFTQNPSNKYDQRYYIDIAQRRGYADSYYNCIVNM